MKHCLSCVIYDIKNSIKFKTQDTPEVMMGAGGSRGRDLIEFVL